MKTFYFILFLMLTIAFNGHSQEITVVDTFGRQIVLPEKVEKIAAIGPGALRMLVYVGAQDLIVGREMFEEKLEKTLRPYTYVLPENYMRLPVISPGGPGKMPNIEKLLMAAPDVIIASVYTKAQMDDISRKTKIPVIGVTYGDVGHTELEKVKESLRLLGYVTKTQNRAQKIINFMAIMKKDLLERTEGMDKKLIYMASIAFKGSRDFNSTERNHPSCSLVGLLNMADDVSQSTDKGTHITLQMETVLKKQPDYIFYDVTGFGILEKSYTDKYKMLKLLKAVRDGNVYSVMPYNWYNSNVENIYLTAYYIGKVVYPDNFKDIDILRKADDIYNVFLGDDPFPKILKKNKVYRRMIFEESGFRFAE